MLPIREPLKVCVRAWGVFQQRLQRRTTVGWIIRFLAAAAFLDFRFDRRDEDLGLVIKVVTIKGKAHLSSPERSGRNHKSHVYVV